jgi:predicted dehydrogenase
VGDSLTPLTLLLEKGGVQRPKLGSGDPVDAFVAELGEVVRSVAAGTPSPLLAGELARDALVLCQKQTESVRKGKAVKI